jgi:tetratricopeptide (TPR) repeat protein
MTALSQAYATALDSFQAGDLPRAEAICQEILGRAPTHAQALHLLGVLVHQAGRHEDAVGYIRRAIASGPPSTEFHYNLGVALQVLGRRQEAIATYQQALRLNPDHPQAHNNLGHAFLVEGRLDEALASLRQALRLSPDYAEAHANLGEALRRQGKPEEAVACLRQALRFRPELPEAHNYLGLAFGDLHRPEEGRACFEQVLRLRPNDPEAHHHLGLVLLGQRRFDEGRSCFEKALRLKPEYAEAHSNLAVLLREQGQLPEAMAHLEEALRLQPGYAAAHNNLGRVLEDQRRLEEAAACYQQAVRLEPDSVLYLNNLANTLTAQGKPDEAVPHYRRAIRLEPGEAVHLSNLGNALTLVGRPDEAEALCRQALRLRPDFADAYHNLAISLGAQGKIDEALRTNREALLRVPDHVGARNCQAMWWLQQGNCEQGWQEYEWRWKKTDVSPRLFPQPLWDGSPLGGRTILIHTEQGLGDTFQFIRYAPLVKRRGGTVVVECQRSLLQLLSSCPGVDQLVARGEPLPDFDVHVPLLGLPGVFGTTLATIPAEVPYLFPEPDLAVRWGDELGAPGGFKVGIGWQGNPRFPGDCMRSVPLTHFAPLGRIEGVRLFSLQKGEGAEQLRAAAKYLPVTDLGERLDETAGAFMDTAAVMKNLDLVITSDTATAHLAGALGVPVWVVLALGADWRYLLYRQDSPWYPTMRLFRQRRLGDWDEVFERVASEVGRLLGGPARCQPVPVEIAPGELIDKITILQIRSERVAEADKLRNVRAELAALAAARDRALYPSAALAALTAELKRVNETLWGIEDDIRLCEREQDFGPRFIELARSVYRENDRRTSLKRQINELLGSTVVEEKAYASYQSVPASGSGKVNVDLQENHPAPRRGGTGREFGADVDVVIK